MYLYVLIFQVIDISSTDKQWTVLFFYISFTSVVFISSITITPTLILNFSAQNSKYWILLWFQLLDDIMGCLNRGRTCLALPKRKNIEELVKNPNVVRISAYYRNTLCLPGGWYSIPKSCNHRYYSKMLTWRIQCGLYFAKVQEVLFLYKVYQFRSLPYHFRDNLIMAGHWNSIVISSTTSVRICHSLY